MARRSGAVSSLARADAPLLAAGVDLRLGRVGPRSREICYHATCRLPWPRHSWAPPSTSGPATWRPLRGIRSENGDVERTRPLAFSTSTSWWTQRWTAPRAKYVEARHQTCIEAYPSPFSSDGTPEPNGNQGVSTTHHVKDSLQLPRNTAGLPKTLPSTYTGGVTSAFRSANSLIWRALGVRYRTCFLTHLDAWSQSDDDRELALVNMDNGSRGARSEKTQIQKKQWPHHGGQSKWSVSHWISPRNFIAWSRRMRPRRAWQWRRSSARSWRSIMASPGRVFSPDPKARRSAVWAHLSQVHGPLEVRQLRPQARFLDLHLPEHVDQ